MILNIRKILKDFEQSHNVKLHLGGVNMIADDMVEFVKSDLHIFSYVIVGLIVGLLYILLQDIRFVLIPILISALSIITISGCFGLFGWEITVISSNFISLVLIMNISLVVHLIVKYKELSKKDTNKDHKTIIKQTLLSMIKPSFFVVATTIVGFSSLVFSGILPVVTFGWMMSVGIFVSLVLTFLLFPIFVLLLPNYQKQTTTTNQTFTSKIANISLKYQKIILFVAFVVVIFSISGAYKLRVENSFIDYFKKTTQIYQGMKLIDQKIRWNNTS